MITAKNAAVFAAIIVLFYFAEVHHVNYTRLAGPEQDIFSNDDLIQMTADGDIGRRIGVVLLGLGGVLLCMRNRGKLRCSFGTMEIALVVFVVWLAFSICWSDDLMLTIRRSTSFLLLWTAAGGFACHFKEREGLWFLFVSTLTFVLYGLATELMLGSFSPTDPMYRFAGTLHPNHQAWNCCGLALASFGLAATERRHRAVFMLCCGGAIAMLVLTKSRTTVWALAFSAVLYFAMTVNRRLKIILMCAAATACLTTALVFGGVATDAERALLLGRSSQDAETFTGRTEIWKVGMSYFADRPFLGYGFNAFETPRRIDEFERKAGWAALTLHSEYMDLLLGVGMVGLATYLTVLLGGISRTLSLFRRTHNRYYVVELALLACVLWIMFLENVSRDPNILAFTVMVTLSRRVLPADRDNLRVPLDIIHETNTRGSQILRCPVGSQPTCHTTYLRNAT